MPPVPESSNVVKVRKNNVASAFMTAAFGCEMEMVAENDPDSPAPRL